MTIRKTILAWLQLWAHKQFVNRVFKNTYELLNLRGLKFSSVNKIYIFQCIGEIFCVVFQRYPLKFHKNTLPLHWKIWFVYNIDIWRALRFKSSYGFMECIQSSQNTAQGSGLNSLPTQTGSVYAWSTGAKTGVMTSVASFTNEVNPRLAKHPLVSMGV